jgi:hypothetical protein
MLPLFGFEGQWPKNYLKPGIVALWRGALYTFFFAATTAAAAAAQQKQKTEKTKMAKA